MPTLLTALAYEAVFRVPIAEIFPGIAEGVEQEIDRNLREFEKLLRKRASVSDSHAVSRKLDWISERRSAIRHR